jgi:hypothetical protein
MLPVANENEKEKGNLRNAAGKKQPSQGHPTLFLVCRLWAGLLCANQ